MPRGMAIKYSLNWYYLPNVFDDTADYLICTRCHADHIKGTALEAQFKQIEWPDGEVAVCGFRFPRIKEVLWPEAIRTNNLNALREYMTRRLQFKPCPGLTMTKAAEGRVLYGMMDNDIEGFVACEACYEDYIVGTSFEPKFGTYPEGVSTFSCDLSISYIAGSVAPMSKHNNWNGFINTASRRFQLPACKGEQIRTDAGEWYLSKNHAIENFQVCETCYLDKLALTPFKREFQRIDNDFDPELWSCGLADRNLSTLMALGEAEDRRDFEVFVKAARVICSLVPCTSDGILYGNWWTLKGGCEKFNICEACYAGFIQAKGLDRFFQPSDRDTSSAYVCDFCPSTPRFGQYIVQFAEMLDRGVFSYFSDFVTTFAGVPACPKIKGYSKKRWWGYPEAQFCQECYLDFVAHTPLGNSLPLNGRYIDETTLCQIWSPRLREMWLEVCSAGEPGSEESDAALEQFRTFCVQRVQIYLKTVSQIEVIRTMQNIKKQTAFNSALLSIQYSGMDARSSIFGNTDGHKYGNSSIGWFNTSYGAQSREYFNEFTNGLSDSNRPEDWMRIAQLESIWKQVE
ncbi:hypothetical protein TrVFT333_008349 [Trichoderma virens FT-333]|nr:hypothetical protein TrVFT333_008349 [Trichoderma virens FT-333]